MWEIVKMADKRAGIKKDVSLHFMRHSHATHALERGAPIHLVQVQLVHASLTNTSKYTHVSALMILATDTWLFEKGGSYAEG